MATRIGVDIGGTFTDLIFHDDREREIRVAKVQTSPERPDDGVIQVIEETLASEAISRARYLLHGTTVGLNALLQRKGAVVGLLATDGFRDCLEIRRGNREDMYNLFWRQPAPLVPRRLRLPARGRILADGRELRPLEADDIDDAVERFNAEGVNAVAVAFMNSYANPTHELEAESLLRAAGFEGAVSLSHRVSGEYREYERTSTTVIDAYVREYMVSYLGRLEARLRGLDFDGTPLVTRSGGGSMSFAEAGIRPFETIMSGPVAGAEGASELARRLALGDLVTADVGGTSFDTALIVGGQPEITYEGAIIGMPVQSPWIDVRSIGAGGGSIVTVDRGGLLHVGPESAGADPGPACYGRGGQAPTVTDCALALGMLGPGKLASGLVLDPDKAQAAIAPLAAELDFSTEDAARGVLTIAAANMANAIREITVQRGIDPRRMTLLAYGGAGPLMGTLLCRELGMKNGVIPPHAGNFSAWGLLSADLTREAARTRMMRLSDENLATANDILEELFRSLDERDATQKGTMNGYERSVTIDMRYLGQEHALTIPVDAKEGRIGLSAGALRERFDDAYERTFGITMEEPAEFVTLRATVRTPLPRRDDARSDVRTLDASAPGAMPAYSFTGAECVPFRLFDRVDLAVGQLVEGPALIVEPTATTYLDRGFIARLDASGCLFVRETG